MNNKWANKTKEGDNMHSPIYILTLSTNYVPDEEIVTDLANRYYDADYISHLPEETEPYKKRFLENMKTFFPNIKVNGKECILSIEDAKHCIEELISLIKKHNETLSVDTFRSWKNDLKYQYIESVPAFILDGSFYFLPEFTSILYNDMNRRNIPIITITLQDVYDMHC